MNVTKAIRQSCLLLLLLTVVFPSDAHAYLDPGTGSMVFQAVVAALAAAAYALRSYWGRIRLLFSRRGTASRVEGPEERI